MISPIRCLLEGLDVKKRLHFLESLLWIVIAGEVTMPGKSTMRAERVKTCFLGSLGSEVQLPSPLLFIRAERSGFINAVAHLNVQLLEQIPFIHSQAKHSCKRLNSRSRYHFTPSPSAENMSTEIPIKEIPMERATDLTTSHCKVPKAKVHVLLFCFAYGSASADTLYRNWIPVLAQYGIVVVPVEHPEQNDVTIKNIDACTNVLVNLLSRWPKTFRYALYGHSYGALLAFFVAKRMYECGRPPCRLFAAAFSAPTEPNPVFIFSIKPIFTTLNRSFIQLKLGRLGALITQSLLGTSTQTCMILQDAHERGLMRSDVRISVPITALHGKEDFVVQINEMEVWSELTTKSCEVVVLNGDHFFLHATQSQDMVLDTIRSRLMCD